MLEFDDIQSAILRPRPLPYAATFLIVRIDDRNAGRALMRRAHDIVGRASQPTSPTGVTWISVALTFQGLKALGMPQASLDSFPIEFQQGMAARADVLADRGESSPEHWEKPLGKPDAHILFAAVAPDTEHLAAMIDPALEALAALEGARLIWRQDCHMLPTGREAFGYKDNISHPAIEGSGIPPTNPNEPPLKAGEFLLGYIDETGKLPPMPVPEELGRNGSYVAFRKLHQRVAEYRQFLKANSASVDEEELLAVVGAREESGAFTIPRWPVRRVVQGLPRFVVTRGGEYCFMPSLRALAWLGALDT